MLKVAVLVSGRGSNLQALIDVCAQEDFPAEIVAVISNIPDVFALERAAEAGIATGVVNHRDYADREVFETALQEAIAGSGAELVCLAGFMRILTAGFVNRWRDRLVNIHPSLLPSFKGLHVHDQALAAGVRVSAVPYILLCLKWMPGRLLFRKPYRFCPMMTPMLWLPVFWKPNIAVTRKPCA